MTRVLVLGTGGTIAGHAASAGAASYRSGQVEIADLLPNLAEAGIEGRIASEQIANIGSQDMDAGVWRALHARITTVFAANEADAVVIAHGTDTLEETGFWLDATLPAGPDAGGFRSLLMSRRRKERQPSCSIPTR